MSILKTGFSAFGKLSAVAILATAFFAALLGVLYFALRSPEVKITSIVGKDKTAGEQEFTAMGLKIRQRATRFSQEKPNTILEQTPIAGEMVKGGQTVSVVISRAEAEGDEKPAEVKKESVDDKKDSTKESNKDDGDDEKDVTAAPKKKLNTNKNANSAKNANSSNKNANSNSNGNANTNSNETANGNTEKNKNTDSGSANKLNLNANSGKSNSNANNRNPPTSGKNTNQNSRPTGTPPPAANNKNTNPAANRRPIP